VSQQQQQVVLYTTQNVRSAVEVLSDNSIISAPVLHDGTNQCVGMLHLLDIVVFVLKVIPEAKDLQLNGIQTLENVVNNLSLEIVVNIIDSSQRQPYFPLHEDTPLELALEYFALGIHRLVLFNDQFELVSSVSHVSILKHVFEQFKQGHLMMLANKTADSFTYGQRRCICIQQTESVISAFRLITENSVNAVGVVDEHNRLVGNFSAFDVRGLYTTDWVGFMLSVESFLRKYSPSSLCCVSCGAKTTLYYIVREMLTARVRRVWIVDENGIPCGVVSTTDIMKLLKEYTFANSPVIRHRLQCLNTALRMNSLTTNSVNYEQERDPLCK